MTNEPQTMQRRRIKLNYETLRALEIPSTRNKEGIFTQTCTITCTMTCTNTAGCPTITCGAQ